MQLGKARVDHPAREQMNGRLHQRGAVQHRAVERATQGGHAAGHVQVHMHPLALAAARAGRRHGRVQQRLEAQRALHQRPARARGHRAHRLSLDHACAQAAAGTPLARHTADQRSQHRTRGGRASHRHGRRATQVRMRATPDRVGRLRPLLDDLAHHVEQDR
ncbi:MAG: hypothetical protein ACK559_30610 [bacterium]